MTPQGSHDWELGFVAAGAAWQMIADVTAAARYDSTAEGWLFALDPAWTATEAEPVPPTTALVGGCRVRPDGTAGPFEPNPEYQPFDDQTPTDPIDAIIRRIVAGERLSEELRITIEHSLVEIACRTDDQLFTVDAPDGTLCAVMVTAAIQRIGIDAARWKTLVGADLGSIIPARVDILINPIGHAPLRLNTDRLRGC